MCSQSRHALIHFAGITESSHCCLAAERPLTAITICYGNGGRFVVGLTSTIILYPGRSTRLPGLDGCESDPAFYLKESRFPDRSGGTSNGITTQRSSPTGRFKIRLVPTIVLLVKPTGFYVYIAASLRRTLYTGMTRDISTRLQQHKAAWVAGFGAKHRTNRLVWCEIAESFEAAR